MVEVSLATTSIRVADDPCKMLLRFGLWACMVAYAVCGQHSRLLRVNDFRAALMKSRPLLVILSVARLGR